MATRSKQFRKIILRIVGGAGYFTVFMEWFLLLALYTPKFFESEVGKVIFTKTKTEPEPLISQPIETASPLEPSAFMAVLFVIAACTLIALICYVIFAKYIPGAAKATDKVVHFATEKTVPVVAHKPKEKIPTKKRKLLTERIQIWIKVVLASVPVAAVYAAYHDRETVLAQLAILGFGVLGTIALGFFMTHFALQKHWKITE
ncbi:hypothetical protein CSA80_02720 [Candidatus Saccharibacteria bacterium]|nr:MAG: hypothetical protein CR973_02835 [Candidatus Saccharibacteria bacterium]PID99006.1 MAG: hypothetical protein CSA80_02720 [Candidatus Saccharibacteria bacterium]